MADEQNLDDNGEELGGAGFSLADLIDLDVSEIAEVRFSTLSQGVYEFEVTSASLDEDTDKDGNRRFKAEIELKVIGVKAVLDAGVDKEALIGKMHKERMFVQTIVPESQALEQIGRIRAFVSDVGMDSKGKLGAIVANLKGHTFTAPIAEQTDKHDKSIRYARLRLEDSSKRKAA